MVNLFYQLLPIFLIVLLSIEVILLCKLDKIFYGTYLTPFVVLSSPYLIVILLAYFIGPLFGFIHLNYKVILILIVYLSIFWFFGSFLMMAFAGKYMDKTKRLNTLCEKYSLRSLLLQLTWVIIIILTVKLIITVKKFGGFYIWHDDFSRYFNSGFAGHLMTFAILVLMYLVMNYRKGERGVFMLIASILIFLFIYQVKTWIFIPAITTVFFFALGNRFTIKSRNVIFITIITYIIFLLIYYPASGFSSNYFTQSYTYTFIFKHILFYLFSGTLSFSQLITEGIKTNVNPDLIVGPFINIYDVLFSHRHLQTIASEFYYYIDLEKIESSNVATFFGTLIIYSGFIGAGIYTVITGIITYFLLIVNSFYKNIWLLIMYLFLLAGLAMGWFNFYYNNLNFVEIPVYCLVLAILSEIRYNRVK